MKKLVKTSDYNLFEVSTTNRPVSPAHMRRIKKSMAQRGFLESFPIIVKRWGNRFIVTDGQHRLQAARELGIPVVYIESEFEIDPSSVPAGKRWSTEDFIRRYANAGKYEYQKTLMIAGEFGVSIDTVVKLLTNDMSANRTEAIRDGRMEIVNESITNQILSCAVLCIKRNPSLLVNPVVKSFHRVSNAPEVIAFSTFSKRVALNAEQMIRFNNVEVGVQQMENAYNFHLPVASRIPIAHGVNLIMAERKRSFGATNT